MKKVILTSAFVLVSILNLSAQETTELETTNQMTEVKRPMAEQTMAQYEVKVITSVESIVPLGLGRSRLISSNAERDYKAYTSEQTEEDNTRNKSKRKDIRVKDFEETKLLNFYNVAGIRFQNIAANDAVISSKITDMLSQGWDLAFVTSAVESDAGDQDGKGIFITRYIFKRKK